MNTGVRLLAGACGVLLAGDAAQAARISSFLPHLTSQENVKLDAPTSTGRQLLQYSNRNCSYYGNCNYWSGGRIAGIIVGIVCFCAAILCLILSLIMRRRRLARTQGPTGTYPVQQPYPNQAYPQTYPNQTYPNQTYPNQGYPAAATVGTAGYNPANPYPAPGVPVSGPYQGEGKAQSSYNNGVQMQSLPQEQPYKTNV